MSSQSGGLSDRLSMVADLIPACRTMADVGCDHAYLAMEMAGCGMAERVICSDVNEGPLQRARENIISAGFGDRIETRLSDGLEGLSPGEAQVIVIAGMGGRLMTEIINRGSDRARAAKALVLQPQSDLEVLRHELFCRGYRFLDEDAVREGDKFYFAMKVCYGKTKPPELTRAQIIRERYGPILWQRRHPVLREYIQREWERKARLLVDDRIPGERRQQLEEELYTDGIALQHLNEG